MAEPEEFEEDLFADLYDGNDTNQVTSTGVTESSAEAKTWSAAPQTDDFQNSKGYEASYENSHAQDAYQGQETGGIQSYHSTDETSQDINVHTGEGVHSTEGEAHGTGIKEDGGIDAASANIVWLGSEGTYGGFGMRHDGANYWHIQEELCEYHFGCTKVS